MNRPEEVTYEDVMAVVAPFSQIYSAPFRLSADAYRDAREERALQDLRTYTPHEAALLEYYRTVVQGDRMPDLLGKTVRVGPGQFPDVHRIATEVAGVLGAVPPTIFVYPDPFYRVGMEGLDYQWMELSSALVQEFTEAELRFVIGTQLARVHCGHHQTEALIEAAFSTAAYLDRVPLGGLVKALPVVEGYVAFLRASANRWRRIATYTTDACGLLMCGSAKDAVSAIMKLVLNNAKLVEAMDVKHFVAQAEEIDRLHQVMMRWSKLDEPIPYGPHRIVQLFRYASSTPAKRALAQLMDGRAKNGIGR